MLLEGSCQCGKVRFTVESTTPYPYQICFCSICRKCTGGAFGCNIMGRHDTLVVHGKRSLKRYHARIHARGKTTLAEGWRAFCGACGTHLWLEDKRWPDGIWPNAGAIDTKLPVPPTYTLIMTRYKPAWVPWPKARAQKFPEYPKESIANWHDKRGLTRR